MSSSVDTSYEPYARDPAYVALNHELIGGVDWRAVTDVVDVACGAGTMSTLAWRELERLGRERRASMVGVDISDEALLLAAKRWKEEGSLATAMREGRARLVRAPGDALPLASRVVDAVLLGNAVHIFDDKAQLLAELARVLRPGGFLGFNTAFYAGTFPEGTEAFYRAWLREALSTVRASDGMRTRRGRTRGERAFSRRWLSADEYGRLLESCGFDVRRSEERTTAFSCAALQALGAYSGLASVLLSGYPEPVACKALSGAVEPALRSAGVEEVPRRWLEIVAVKRRDASRS